MASDQTYTALRDGARRRWTRSGLWGALAAVLAACAVLCAWMLEQRDAGLTVTELRVADTPVTFYRTGANPAPVVVVAHGFGGSRQMMDQIAITLARGGLAVASFDFPGHGRNAVPLSPNVTEIEGTTAQLVDATTVVLDAMLARSDTTGTAALVGHSMATDVIIRAAEGREDVAAIAAISMYSEAITASHPQRLLVVSGATEGHLRAAGVSALELIEPGAVEGRTVTDGDVVRRAVAAPWVGHVGVLYAPTTLAELQGWIAQAFDVPERGTLDTSGWIAGVLLLSLVLLGLPLCQFVPRAETAPPTLPLRQFLILSVAPVVPTIAAMLIVPAGLAGFGGFGALAFGFAIWGGVQTALLWRMGHLRLRADALGTALFLIWGVGVFALALDRYGASFLPTGPRVGIMLALAVAILPLMLADAHLTAGAALWRRVAARVFLLISFATAMGLAPTTLGISFTVLPVLVLFFLVYGSFGRWISARRGPIWPGSAVALAWAVAASTPLFAVVG